MACRDIIYHSSCNVFIAPRVRHMLKDLPETLDKTYERILRDIITNTGTHSYLLSFSRDFLL